MHSVSGRRHLRLFSLVERFRTRLAHGEVQVAGKGKRYMVSPNQENAALQEDVMFAGAIPSGSASSATVLPGLANPLPACLDA